MINNHEEYLRSQARLAELTEKLGFLVQGYAESVHRLEVASKDYVSQVDEIISGKVPAAEAKLLRDIADSMIAAVLEVETPKQEELKDRIAMVHNQVTVGFDMMVEYMTKEGNHEMVNFLRVAQAALSMSRPS